MLCFCYGGDVDERACSDASLFDKCEYFDPTNAPDGLLDARGVALVVVERGGEVVDVAQAVAAEGEVGRTEAHSVVANVKGVLK